MRVLYLLGSYLAFALLLPFLLVHPKTRHGLRHRLGLYRAGEVPSRGRPRIWLHGASAGDLAALAPMVRGLRARHPDATILLTTFTNSGYLMAKERLAGVDFIGYAPYDLWGATRRAVRALMPDLLVLEYTEIWPNLLRAASRAGARVALTNGRFSDRRLAAYRLFFGAIGNPLRDVDQFLMREEDEAERARALGAPRDRVLVTGNTKFDALLENVPARSGEELRRALAFPEGARVFIAGSTHEGEEPAVVDVFRRLLLDCPDLRLVVAPRYVERAGRVAAIAEAAGLSVRLRSQGPAEAPPRVVVLDTIGELAGAYAAASLVFVGGSFTRRGGQNILEPAAQGKPVLFGPNMENFHDSVKVLVGRGGIQVNDPEHLYRVAHELLRRPEKLAELGALARAAVTQVRGASARNIEHLSRLAISAPSGAALVRRILLIRYSALGDVVLATPVARALKARFPGAELHWLTDIGYAPLLEGLPFVDRVLRYDKSGAHAGLAGMIEVREELAAAGFDLCVDLQAKPRTLFFRNVAPRRVTLRRWDLGRALRSLVGRDPVLVRPHAVDLYAAAVAPLGVVVADRQPVVRAPAIERRPRAAIAPGGRWATKRWPPERYAEVARALLGRGLEVVLVGGADDADLVADVRRRIGVPASDTVGQSADALARLLAGCVLFVGNDTGPAHLAAAVGTPVVAVFGPTPVERWRPLGPAVEVVRLDLPCSPCTNHGGRLCPLGTHACMRDLGADRVLAAVAGVLERGAREDVAVGPVTN